jgi:hypothetical protein
MSGIGLGRVNNLAVSFAPSAVLGSAVIWAVTVVVAVVIFHVGLAEALAGGLIFTLLHWFSELIHNFGHAAAARRSGHPMTGVEFYLVIGLSQYPRDEPELPAGVHIRRALGGPTYSAVLVLAAALITTGMAGLHVPLTWVALLFLCDNLFVFSLGAFLPLGFTDGSTILRWWGKR